MNKRGGALCLFRLHHDVDAPSQLQGRTMATTPLLTVASSSASPVSDFSSALYLFLDKLSPAMVGRLYEAPASCLSIFRCVLSPASRRSQNQREMRELREES